MTPTPFTTVLVANRGEIALRVVRAVREAGLRSVAVYSDADAGAPHVLAADEAVRLGPTPAAESYLSIDAVLDAARRSGADAVHPGYGFLSERAAFARAVADAGLVFIGPSADVMDLMGRKDHARAVAERAGVPVTWRYEISADGHGADVPADAYPVLVKAAAGGGGKGMRVVRAPGELDAALAAARREAASAFGDDTLLVEQYVQDGRHVEVQVFGDHHGTVLHLLERDCSVQRRHQKVLEEAPAPTITPATRERLLTSAVSLAREVGYVGAGTVEYLVWGHGDDERLAFLEMNTRLQVEHPVTEEVTGLDLVRWQLDVAAGLPLPITQDDVRCDGHAFEARVYAEDPGAGFLPQAGTPSVVRWPAGVRVETALEAGQEVGTAYDPMVAKVVVHGADRESARRALVAALDGCAVVGLTTNLGFLRRLAASDACRDAAVHTAWLDGDAAEPLVARPPVPAGVGAAAARAWVRTELGTGPLDPGPFATRDGWRAGGPAADVSVVLTDVDGLTRAHRVPLAEVDAPGAVASRVRDDLVTVVVEGQDWEFVLPGARRSAQGAAGDADVVSPMPGTVLDVGVEVGAEVRAGDVLGVVEAMKMELALKAPHDGVVALVGASVGDQVPLGHLLFRVDAEPGA
ncbi:MAG: biotin carboxylase N-terminal domain-containing protein [Nocardioidaceae bacterium]|nr:biotin carboxylase N-terminal domain-containing protein [Nocardioidaceae bacterium]